MIKILAIILLFVHSIYNFELYDNFLGHIGLTKDPF